jgi:hypothetical protein
MPRRLFRNRGYGYNFWRILIPLRSFSSEKKLSLPIILIILRELRSLRNPLKTLRNKNKSELIL